MVASPRSPRAYGPALNVLLFGRPGAGKSALLGALYQAASEPSPLFKGRLADDSGALTSLAQGTYADTLEHTRQEVVRYPVHFEPQEPGGESWSATLLDSSGAVAQHYLHGQRRLEDSHPLAHALLGGDTLILVVDASAPAEQLEKDFTEFGQFLRLLQQVRGRRADVTGLPIYLVLTKCDLLARPGDARSAWMQRIEEAKLRLGQKFHDFLALHDRPVFGAVRLHVWATATRRPALSDAPARPEPYGVAELFRQCLNSASVYRQRRDMAGQRLSLIVIALGALVGLCALGMWLLLMSQPDRDLERLKEQVGEKVPGQALSAAERLRGSPVALADRLQEIRKLQRDPHYPHLPGQLQSATEEYVRELGTYLESYQDYQKTIKLPHLAKNDEELASYEKALREFKLPPEYAEQWENTRLARRLQEARGEYAALYRAEGQELAWIQEQIKETRRLSKQGSAFTDDIDAGRPPPASALQDWFRAVDDQLEPHASVPRGELIPGVSGLTYERLDHLPRVRQARADWAREQAVLRALAEVLRGRVRKGTPM